LSPFENIEKQLNAAGALLQPIRVGYLKLKALLLDYGFHGELGNWGAQLKLLKVLPQDKPA